MNKGTRPSSQATRKRPGQLFLLTAAFLFVWLTGWIWFSWPYMLDDALIHLRYADFLLHQHRITYDGVHASFGTSSLLYVSVLACLRAATTSPILPRIVSSAVYLVLFLLLAGVLYGAARRREDPPAFVWLLAGVLLAVLVAPSAVRWLDDGMETGLVFLDAVLGIVLARRLVRSASFPPRILVSAFIWGMLTVLLRVELLLLAGFVSVVVGLEIFTGPVRRVAVEHRGLGLAATAMPLLGALAGAGIIFLTMHALLPDTALAKAYGAADWESTLQMTGVTVVSSFSFGIGLLLLWLVSAAGLLLCDRMRLADVAANLLFFTVLFLSAIRGQQIQGIRYFGWTMLFPLLWNYLRICEVDSRPAPAAGSGLRWTLAVLAVALVPAFAAESMVFRKVFFNRVATLRTFEAQTALPNLAGRLGIAEDVGFVGYFTQGNICDPYGLVNGRALARLGYQERLDRCIAQHPQFAFGSRLFLQKVVAAQSLQGWSVCGQYPFENVRTADIHFLAVAPGLASQVCPREAEPIREALPGLL